MSDESERVKKHKRSRMKQGYKNVSFLVSPEEFKMIKKEKKQRKMCTRELLIYFVSGQYIRDRMKHEYYNYHDWKLTTDEILQKDYEEFGTAHKFKNKKDFVVLAYLTVDRKKIRLLNEFDTYEQAEEYCENNKSKRRIAIFEKEKYSEENFYSERYWY